MFTPSPAQAKILTLPATLATLSIRLLTFIRLSGPLFSSAVKAASRGAEQEDEARKVTANEKLLLFTAYSETIAAMHYVIS